MFAVFHKGSESIVVKNGKEDIRQMFRRPGGRREKQTKYCLCGLLCFVSSWRQIRENTNTWRRRRRNWAPEFLWKIWFCRQDMRHCSTEQAEFSFFDIGICRCYFVCWITITGLALRHIELLRKLFWSCGTNIYCILLHLNIPYHLYIRHLHRYTLLPLPKISQTPLWCKTATLIVSTKFLMLRCFIRLWKIYVSLIGLAK